ncbi:hypothetical protein LSH36_108g07137 [Paralvinella palmiformis]|uniref:DNTTIP1 dimerisation domain-containing protein n=1 Tax=Paralvinella palmiformis TaxID=53620 RepID=A0AAD9JZG8_9ANNE|nr:hypothetical protein LSH36_108g07137 [Paralvinella palmiformis]
MVLNVTGGAVIGSQSCFNAAQSTHRTTTLPTETMIPGPRVGMPTLVASGLVSLPVASAAGPQPPKIHVTDDNTSGAPESIGVINVGGRSPNPQHSTGEKRLSVSPVSRAGSPYRVQQSAKEVIITGNLPQTVQGTFHRVSPNHMTHSTISMETSRDRILTWCKGSVVSSMHTASKGDMHRTIPVVTIQKNSSVATNRLTPPTQSAKSSLDQQNASPQHRVSPVPRRVSPVPRRVSPVPQRTSPVQRRTSPEQHRVSPVLRRMSPLQHRVSPVNQAIPKHIISALDQHNPLPVFSSKAVQMKVPVLSVPGHDQHNSSACHTICTSVRTAVSKQCENIQLEKAVRSSGNPFIAAMTATKSKTAGADHNATMASSLNDPLHSFVIINKLKPAVCDIKVENVDESEVKQRVSESGDSSSSEPVCKNSCSIQSTSSLPHVVLSRQATNVVTTASISGRKYPGSSKLAATMPLLSNIMGLTPKSDDMFRGVANLQQLKTEDSKSAMDNMPKLFPEMSSVATRIKLEKVPLADEIKEEQEEGTTLMPMTNPFCLRLKNLNNFPSNNTNAYRPAYRSQGMAIHRAKTGCIMNAARSLDLLRSNLQKFINKEIDDVIQKYINVFFRPGIDNIRENNGHMAVSDDHIQAVCQQILEEAKKLYATGSRCNTPDPNDNVSESGSLAPPESRDIREKKLDLFRIKKRRGSSDSEASISKKPKRKGRPPLKLSNGRPTTKQNRHEPVKKEGPKWDPDRLVPEIKFVMGAKANKALGLGAQRGRLYIKHPDLFKYAGDQEDKNWLHENHHMPATGGKAYLLVVDDVLNLAETEEYRDSPGLMLDEIVGFTVPDWMREKMKIQMKALRTDSSKSSKTKQPAQPSPSTTENMDMASTDQDVDDLPSVSPLNMTGGFTSIGQSPDVSPPPSVGYEDVAEPPLTAPFELGEALQ